MGELQKLQIPSGEQCKEKTKDKLGDSKTSGNRKLSGKLSHTINTSLEGSIWLRGSEVGDLFGVGFVFDGSQARLCVVKL